ncbi:unnamed protein product, partial [Amoebophrya sp. A25]
PEKRRNAIPFWRNNGKRYFSQDPNDPYDDASGMKLRSRVPQNGDNKRRTSRSRSRNKKEGGLLRIGDKDSSGSSFRRNYKMFHPFAGDLFDVKPKGGSYTTSTGTTK